MQRIAFDLNIAHTNPQNLTSWKDLRIVPVSVDLHICMELFKNGAIYKKRLSKNIYLCGAEAKLFFLFKRQFQRQSFAVNTANSKISIPSFLSRLILI